MNFAEFHAAARQVAKGRMFSAMVESTEHAVELGGGIQVEWRIYIDGLSWSEKYKTPEDALAEMRAKDDGTWKESAPQTAADIEAVGSIEVAF
jgi:hypothetical protein